MIYTGVQDLRKAGTRKKRFLIVMRKGKSENLVAKKEKKQEKIKGQTEMHVEKKGKKRGNVEKKKGKLD